MTVEQRRNIAGLLADPDGAEKIREQFSPGIVRQLVAAGLIPRKNARNRRPRRWYRTPKDQVVAVLQRDGLRAAQQQFDHAIVNTIAREMGMLGATGSRLIWRDEWNLLLGTKPDTDLAAELGVSRALVGRYRNLAGVAAHVLKPAPIQSGAPPRRAAQQRVAQIPDDVLAASTVRDLAERYDVNIATIHRERHRRSIVLRPIKQRLILGAREERGQTMTRAMVAGAAAAGCSLKEIGDRLGFSRERARQILEVALHELQAVLNEQNGAREEESVEGDGAAPEVEHRVQEKIDKIQRAAQAGTR